MANTQIRTIAELTEVLGIDVSKDKLDCHLHRKAISLRPQPNNVKGFQVILKWLNKHLGPELSGLKAVMEHTGIYTYGLECFLHGQGIAYLKRPALDIKRSSGMVRGKSDKTDAAMISRYGWTLREELGASESKPPAETLLRLRQLSSWREQLVSDRAAHKSRVGELQKAFGDAADPFVLQSAARAIAALSEEIKDAEAAIKSLLASEPALEGNYRLALWVPGIGPVTALAFIISTENFSRFEGDARKYCCYCGVVPFEHSSGSSLNGRPRLSHLANKRLKSLLTQCAVSAIRHDPELKEKYNQKIAEGKHVMSAINIIRAKLIQRVFAVVNRQTPYQPKQQQTANAA